MRTDPNPVRISLAIAVALVFGALAGFAYGARVGDVQVAAAQAAARSAMDGADSSLQVAEQLRAVTVEQSATIAKLRAAHTTPAATATVSTRPSHRLHSRAPRKTVRTPRRSYGSIPTLIRRLCASAGWSGTQADAMVEIARRESTFRPTATNGRCFGLFQLSAGKVAGHDWTDPAWNTRRAIAYIRSRYGTPLHALAHHDAHGWY